MNREFLQLSHRRDDYPNIHIGGWMVSEKLDGMRAFWDGGLTRGMLASEIPFANTEKDARLKTKPVSTGLWSRYGKVIHAPDWWLDTMPTGFLDGELYCGRKNYQKLRDIAGHHSGDAGWSEVSFMAFDCPNPSLVFGNGRINNPNFKKDFEGINGWAASTFDLSDIFFTRAESVFSTRYDFMKMRLLGTRAIIVEQDVLPLNDEKANCHVNDILEHIMAKGGEGLIIRDPNSYWEPKRIKGCLKVKPTLDSEATVVGYIWGRQTDKGSKLLGLMGALIVEWEGKRFELSGFTDAERQLSTIMSKPYQVFYFLENAGKHCDQTWRSIHFPVGSKVTFKYRELSDDGIPKEARYWRKSEQ